MKIISTSVKLLDPLSSHKRSELDLFPLEKEALHFLLPLSVDYPSIERWFVSKVVPGLRVGSRTLLRVERGGDLVGIGIAKKEVDERKICTVRVAPSYFGRGVGLRIFDGLLHWLDDDKPHLTVNKEKLELFSRIFDYYKFDMTSSKKGLYLPDAVEIGYNESIKSLNCSISEPDFQDSVGTLCCRDRNFCGRRYDKFSESQKVSCIF